MVPIQGGGGDQETFRGALLMYRWITNLILIILFYIFGFVEFDCNTLYTFGGSFTIDACPPFKERNELLISQKTTFNLAMLVVVSIVWLFCCLPFQWYTIVRKLIDQEIKATHDHSFPYLIVIGDYQSVAELALFGYKLDIDQIVTIAGKEYCEKMLTRYVLTKDNYKSINFELAWQLYQQCDYDRKIACMIRLRKYFPQNNDSIVWFDFLKESIPFRDDLSLSNCIGIQVHAPLIFWLGIELSKIKDKDKRDKNFITIDQAFIVAICHVFRTGDAQNMTNQLKLVYGNSTWFIRIITFFKKFFVKLQIQQEKACQDGKAMIEAVKTEELKLKEKVFEAKIRNYNESSDSDQEKLDDDDMIVANVNGTKTIAIEEKTDRPALRYAPYSELITQDNCDYFFKMYNICEPRAGKKSKDQEKEQEIEESKGKNDRVIKWKEKYYDYTWFLIEIIIQYQLQRNDIIFKYHQARVLFYLLNIIKRKHSAEHVCQEWKKKAVIARLDPFIYNRLLLVFLDFIYYKNLSIKNGNINDNDNRNGDNDDVDDWLYLDLFMIHSDKLFDKQIVNMNRTSRLITIDTKILLRDAAPVSSLNPNDNSIHESVGKLEVTSLLNGMAYYCSANQFIKLFNAIEKKNKEYIIDMIVKSDRYKHNIFHFIACRFQIDLVNDSVTIYQFLVDYFEKNKQDFVDNILYKMLSAKRVNTWLSEGKYIGYTPISMAMRNGQLNQQFNKPLVKAMRNKYQQLKANINSIAGNDGDEKDKDKDKDQENESKLQEQNKCDSDDQQVNIIITTDNNRNKNAMLVENVNVGWNNVCVNDSSDSSSNESLYKSYVD